jgi:hypothetical protein
MPVTYRIGKADRIIRTRCEGPVTLDEVIDHFRELGKDPECPAHPDVLLDLRRATVEPKSDQLRVVSEHIGRMRDKVQFEVCAILVSTDTFLGIAMVFEVFAVKYFRTTKVFREPDEALAWLVSQRSSVH